MSSNNVIKIVESHLYAYLSIEKKITKTGDVLERQNFITIFDKNSDVAEKELQKNNGFSKQIWKLWY